MRDYHELVEVVNLTHDDTAAEVHATCSDGLYFRIKRMELSVYKSAQGGGGILEILDTVGKWVWTVNVDSVFNKTFDFGEKGLKVGQNVGIQAILSGAQNQASISLCVVGQLSVD